MLPIGRLGRSRIIAYFHWCRFGAVRVPQPRRYGNAKCGTEPMIDPFSEFRIGLSKGKSPWATMEPGESR
jgi:hypothetical protein